MRSHTVPSTSWQIVNDDTAKKNKTKQIQFILGISDWWSPHALLSCCPGGLCFNNSKMSDCMSEAPELAFFHPVTASNPDWQPQTLIDSLHQLSGWLTARLIDWTEGYLRRSDPQTIKIEIRVLGRDCPAFIELRRIRCNSTTTLEIVHSRWILSHLYVSARWQWRKSESAEVLCLDLEQCQSRLFGGNLSLQHG